MLPRLPRLRSLTGSLLTVVSLLAMKMGMPRSLPVTEAVTSLGSFVPPVEGVGESSSLHKEFPRGGAEKKDTVTLESVNRCEGEEGINEAHALISSETGTANQEPKEDESAAFCQAFVLFAAFLFPRDSCSSTPEPSARLSPGLTLSFGA
jgi:hypothetical protein